MSVRAPDPDALLYAEHWEPVLAAPAARLLDRVAAILADGSVGSAGPLTLLDLGTGTGSLALAAAERWPDVHVVGLDASAGMLSVARQRVAQRWPAAARGRFEWLAVDAASTSLPDASVDIIVSSFVLQLVPDRRAVLGEARRVLRPGGVLGFVTWLAEDLMLAADVEFDEAVHDLDIDDPDLESRAPDPNEYESLAEAEDDLAATGFASAVVEADRLEFSWTRQRYLGFKERYDELDLMETLTAADRTRLLARVEERWSGLPDEAFAMSAPLVSATARRPRSS